MLTDVRLRPWWRAPLLLLRRPGVMVALVAAAFVATLPASSAPLFLSSAQSASIARQVDAFPLSFSGVRVIAPLRFIPADEIYTRPDGFIVSGPTIAAARAERAAQAALGVPNLGQMRVTFVAGASLSDRDLGGGVLVAKATSQSASPREVVLLAREGFADQVDVLAGGSGRGVWLPDAISEELQVSVGDLVEVSNGGESVRLPVAAVHRDLRRSTLSPFWAGVGGVLQDPDITQPQLAAVLVDGSTFQELAQSLSLFTDHMVEFPLVDPTPSRQVAGVTVAALPAMREHLFSGDAEPYYFRDQQSGFRSDLPRFVGRSDLVESTLRVPVAAASVAGVAVGLMVVGAAALLWTRRRHRELLVLATHGASTTALGVKGMAEAAPAIVLGTVAGWFVAGVLVVGTGPSPVVAPDAVPRSVGLALAAGLCALVVTGGTAVVRCRALTDAVPARGGLPRLAGVPWELGLLAGAVAAWYGLDANTVVAGEVSQLVGAVVRLPPAVFVTPILAGIGVVILIARAARWWLQRHARVRPPGGNAPFLAWRRVGRDPAASLALVAATALPVALAGYGAIVTESADATLDARAKAVVGADVVIELSEPVKPPPSLTRLGEVAEVARLDGARLGSVRGTVIFVDTDTFAKVADVGDVLVDGSLMDRLDYLETARSPATMLATPTAPTGMSELSFRDGRPIPVRFETVPELPARQSGFPVAMASRRLLSPELAAGARAQLWVRGDDPEAIRAVAERDLPQLERVRLADEQFDGTLVEPVTYTFAYLVAVSVLTAIVVVVGLLLHLESRSVAHRRAYVLLRRMGMQPHTHRGALLWELGGLLIAGAAVGVGVVAGLVALLSSGFDPDPRDLPSTVVTLPVIPFGVIAAAIVLTALSATLFAHSRAARADAGEILRDTT